MKLLMSIVLVIWCVMALTGRSFGMTIKVKSNLLYDRNKTDKIACVYKNTHSYKELWIDFNKLCDKKQDCLFKADETTEACDMKEKIKATTNEVYKIKSPIIFHQIRDRKMISYFKEKKIEW